MRVFKIVDVQSLFCPSLDLETINSKVEQLLSIKALSKN